MSTPNFGQDCGYKKYNNHITRNQLLSLCDKLKLSESSNNQIINTRYIDIDTCLSDNLTGCLVVRIRHRPKKEGIKDTILNYLFVKNKVTSKKNKWKKWFVFLRSWSFVFSRKWVKKSKMGKKKTFFHAFLLFFTHFTFFHAFLKNKTTCCPHFWSSRVSNDPNPSKKQPKYFRFTLPWTNTAYITQGLTKLFSSNYQNQNKYKNSLNYKIINWVMKFLFLIRFLASLATIKTYFLYT
jgi:hypothetical protein